MPNTINALVGTACRHVLQSTNESPSRGFCFVCAEAVEAEMIEVDGDSAEATIHSELNTPIPSGDEGHDNANAESELAPAMTE